MVKCSIFLLLLIISSNLFSQKIDNIFQLKGLLEIDNGVFKYDGYIINQEKDSLKEGFWINYKIELPIYILSNIDTRNTGYSFVEEISDTLEVLNKKMFEILECGIYNKGVKEKEWIGFGKYGGLRYRAFYNNGTLIKMYYYTEDAHRTENENLLFTFKK